MKSIQTKFICLILGCVLICSAVIGGAGILSAKQVIDINSAQLMNRICSEKALELDALLSRIEQSVKTLSVYTTDQLQSVEQLKTDMEYMEEYTRKLEAVAINAADNTEGALAVYVHYNPDFAPPTSGLFWSKTEKNGRFQQLTPTESVDQSLIPMINELKNGSSGNNLFMYQIKGEKRQLAFRTLCNGMQLAVTAPKIEIDHTKNNLILLISIAVIVISAISVFLTVLLTRRLIRPLKELNAAAKKIADGDLSISLTQPSKDEVGTLAESFQQTVGHLQKYINYINGLAYRDSLTGVKNKTAYLEAEHRLEEEMRLGRPEFALVVMDINNLKVTNDHYGHDFGDMLIIDVCKLICKTFKRSPVYRVGGDEFVVILEGGDYENYSTLLEEFEIGMQEHNRSGREDLNLSIARGIAIYNSETDMVFANVFKRADDAMYQNKADMKQRNIQSEVIKE